MQKSCVPPYSYRKYLLALSLVFQLALSSCAASRDLGETTYTAEHISVTVPNGWHAVRKKDGVIYNVYLGGHPAGDLDVAYQVLGDTSVLTTSDEVLMKRGILESKKQRLTFVKHLQDIAFGKNRLHLIYFAMDPKKRTMYIVGRFYSANRFAPCVIYSNKPRTFDQVMNTSLPVFRSTELF